MIFLWLKIMYYKMIKIASVFRAEAGEKSSASRAHHEGGESGTSHEVLGEATRDGIVGYSREPGAPDGTIKTERLRRLIELGLVHEPLPDLDDMIRIDLLHSDRESREIMDTRPDAFGLMQPIPAGWPHPIDPEVPSGAPCDHSPGECRFAAARRDSVTESAERPSNEIVCCGACGHPQHTPGNGLCAFLAPLGDGFQVCHCAGEDES